MTSPERPKPEEILIAFTAGDSPALGNLWRITAKKTDFYLDPLGPAGTVAHLSIHAANGRFDDHRFQIKRDRRPWDEGQFVAHNLPENGVPFNGRKVADRAFLVARIRWTYDLQQPQYRAAVATQAPQVDETHQSAARLSGILAADHAWDLDLVVSYDGPYWPDALGSLHDNARLRPLTNDAGLWLTATSYHRSTEAFPPPSGLSPRLPRPDEQPSRIMCGGLGPDSPDDLYWFMETVTSRELIDAGGIGPGLV